MGRSRVTPLLVILVILLVVTPALILWNSPSPGPWAPSETPIPPGFRMLFVGESSGLARDVLVEFVSRGAPVVMVNRVEEIGPYADRIDARWVVMFNSEWLSGRTDNASLLSFIEQILPSEVKLVAVGGSTSLFFEALRTADTGVYADDRNPAVDNPPLAGYRLRLAYQADGTPYYGDSVLASNDSDPSGLANGVLDWG